jgi:hypothetical protein
LHPALFADADKAIATGLHALLKRQDRDGCWRDFSLSPGASEAWSTAWTGWCIAHTDPCVETITAMGRAASALMRHGRSMGWGYNSTTGPDADSTAWAIRFLAVIAPETARSRARVLDHYVDASGEAHTFLELEKGDWSEAHADVTPVVGLALLRAQAPRDRIKQIRKTILLRAQASWPPKGFWWTNQTYGLAWTLVFLAFLESLPFDLARDSKRWLEAQQVPPDAMGKALELLAWVALGIWNHPRAIAIGCDLLAGVSSDGWPGSASLLVPPQHADSASDGDQCGPFSDSGIMSTGIAIAALARWRRPRSIHSQP